MTDLGDSLDRITELIITIRIAIVACQEDTKKTVWLRNFYLVIVPGTE